MNLFDAPFRKKLRVRALADLPKDARLVLIQLGLDEGELVEKVHTAPLGDPIGLRIGEQLFTLRSELCRKIGVEVV